MLHRFNAEKRISDPEIRLRVEGQFGAADDVEHLRTWAVESGCGDFLLAAPMWADVSPTILTHKGGDLFEDSQGSTWEFHYDSDGEVAAVTMSPKDGAATVLRHWGDPHENLNGKHLKDWKGKTKVE